MKNRKGITLIALVITIIILLILAGVTIAMLTGENGLIAKAIRAKEEHQMNEYKERLNLIIIEEIAERKTESKKERMIKSLDQKIRTKESSWVHEIYKCNEQKQEQKTFEASTHLLVESKEHYEFFIEVNEEENTASIVSQEKGSGKTWKVTYHPNGAEGKEEVVEVKQGFTITTKECEYKKENYNFVGWCENANGEGLKYRENTQYNPEKDTTLYATWELNVAKVILNKNDGTNETKEVTVTKGDDTVLSKNDFVRDGYVFIEWNSKADGTGDSYEDGATINLKEDITLYAKWEKLLTITFNKNGATSGTMENRNVRKGSNITLPENVYQKTGYTFTGWNTSEDGTGTQYSNKATINNVTTDINLYAMWKIIVSAGASNASSYYGATVEGYTLKTVNGINYNEAVSNWKILHIDENNIYLIADYFIHKKYCPSSKNYAIGSYSNHALTMFNVIKDYNGSGDITDNEIKALNSKYFEYLTNNNKTNTNTNAKAMAYMLDKNVWSVYKGNGAKYAIGGPTVELLLNSYNKKHGTSYICEAKNEYGYAIPNVSFDTSDSLYIITNKPQGEHTSHYFIASPYTSNTSYVMRSYR